MLTESAKIVNKEQLKQETRQVSVVINMSLFQRFCSRFYRCFMCSFRFVSMVSAVLVVSFRWFRSGVSGFKYVPYLCSNFL